MQELTREINLEDCYHAISECYCAEDPIGVAYRGSVYETIYETTVSDLYMQSDPLVEARSIKIRYWGGPDFGEQVEGNLYEMAIDRRAHFHETRAAALRKRWAIMRRTKGRLSNARKK